MGKLTLAIRVLTLLALLWVGLEVRWTRGAIPYGLDYSTEQTLNGIAKDLETLANTKGR